MQIRAYGSGLRGVGGMIFRKCQSADRVGTNFANAQGGTEKNAFFALKIAIYASKSQIFQAEGIRVGLKG